MMLLNSISWAVLAWLLLRFVWPLPGGWLVKAPLTLLFLVASRKFDIYRWSSGALFAPDLPRWAMLLLEWIYAALLLLFLLVLVRDLCLVLARVAQGLGWRAVGHFPLTAGAQLAGMALLALALSAWGVWEAVRLPRVRTVEIFLPRADRALDGFTLVQLSDLHIGPLLKGDWLASVVERVNALQPDLVVITGDFVDGSPRALARDMAPLGGLVAPCGVYGVTGNHEDLYNASAWVRALEALGVRMLDSTHALPKGPGGARLVLAGVSDAHARRLGEAAVTRALEGAPDDPAIPRILLVHRPAILADIAREGRDGSALRVDVQLSGHTHGGVMCFLQPLVARYNAGFVRGLYRLGDAQLYVNSGTGLWNGFSCRLGVLAEITRIILRAGRAEASTQESR